MLKKTDGAVLQLSINIVPIAFFLFLINFKHVSDKDNFIVHSLTKFASRFERIEELKQRIVNIDVFACIGKWYLFAVKFT